MGLGEVVAGVVRWGVHGLACGGDDHGLVHVGAWQGAHGGELCGAVQKQVHGRDIGDHMVKHIGGGQLGQQVSPLGVDQGGGAFNAHYPQHAF